jgi:hypothetical protein
LAFFVDDACLCENVLSEPQNENDVLQKGYIAVMREDRHGETGGMEYGVARLVEGRETTRRNGRSYSNKKVFLKKPCKTRFVSYGYERKSVNCGTLAMPLTISFEQKKGVPFILRPIP